VPGKEKQAGVSVPMETTSICRGACVRAWDPVLRGMGWTLEDRVRYLLSWTVLGQHLKGCPYLQLLQRGLPVTQTMYACVNK
jgi:hypothetical protein